MFLPHEKVRSVLHRRCEVFEFVSVQDEGADFSFDIVFCFPTQIVQVILVDISHQHQVDDAGIFALGIIVYEIGLFQIAQSGQDAVDDLVQAHDLAGNGSQLREKRVLVVCRVKNVASILLRREEFRLRELVELFADGVGRDPEFLGQLP